MRYYLKISRYRLIQRSSCELNRQIFKYSTEQNSWNLTHRIVFNIGFACCYQINARGWQMEANWIPDGFISIQLVIYKGIRIPTHSSYPSLTVTTLSIETPWLVILQFLLMTICSWLVYGSRLHCMVCNIIDQQNNLQHWLLRFIGIKFVLCFTLLTMQRLI